VRRRAGVENSTSEDQAAKEKFMMRPQISVTIAGLLIWAGAASAAIAADAATGKAPYEKTCAGCHGADGKGNPKMAAILGDKGLDIVGDETKKKSDEQLLKVIAEGAGKMPASKLSKEEQKQVLIYVRSLAK
jgi:mono/diheme cytochrome c family protein